MVNNVTQAESGITTNVGVSVTVQNNIICLKMIIFGILLYVVVYNGKYVTNIIGNLLMRLYIQQKHFQQKPFQQILLKER